MTPKQFVILATGGQVGFELLLVALAISFGILVLVFGVLLKWLGKPVGGVTVSWRAAFKSGASIAAVFFASALAIGVFLGPVGVYLAALAIWFFGYRIIVAQLQIEDARAKRLAAILGLAYIAIKFLGDAFGGAA